MKALIGIIFVLFGVMGSAYANDSSATLSAGGLRLTHHPHITMTSEVLRISPDQVQVDYQFKNTASHDIETLVAFPLPVIDTYQAQWEDLNVSRNACDNYLNFHVSVDGKPVQTEKEVKAFVSGKDVSRKDVSQELLQHQIPLSPFDATQETALKQLPLTVKNRMAAQQIVEIDGPEIYPKWRYQATFFWKQSFPAYQTLNIRHTYQPVVGQALLEEARFKAEKKRYAELACVGPVHEKALQHLFDAQKGSGDKNPLVRRQQIDYVLSTGANWKGPIERFEIVIDTGSPHAVLASCLNKIQQTGPTTYSATYQQYTPRHELHLLIFSVQEAAQ